VGAASHEEGAAMMAMDRRVPACHLPQQWVVARG
jgi:hypothetical protein